MSGLDAGLAAHLAGGVTTLARCWRVTRRDGRMLGFTDHDCDLAFGGVTFRASDGLSARAVEQTTGLAVDNTEALGVLSDAGLTEADIAAGRYDGAGVTAWLVNWADPAQRMRLFQGEIGEIARSGGAFRAELRGLTDLLNQPQGRVYQTACSAVLGDGACKVDLTRADLSAEVSVDAVEGAVLILPALARFADRWFEQGRLVVLTGASAGQVRVVKNDRRTGEARRIEVWDALRGGIAPGDRVRLEAGCDKRAETCRAKFANMANHRGFPHLPSEDWLMAYPAGDATHDGGSLRE
ncbi:hypothetical protein OCGS_2376 [Oceaniovalibus guishaninsula JLT2003]|uniref:Bacteriophage phiJL001 Gp84 C-terminal domain-containing protein n=1 Tax=Oceaniovalibus guishaninsula JLT2003 TaxID=1231392 RepID=K2HLB2_9RHOB|nr:DUF2163 domain-containing protein [Oceaniovalibus guishaninsula]EKE43644.1 hypothetical protein OCGS_2376 [Oceaniovalibus guishaninsula JLT2003]